MTVRLPALDSADDSGTQLLSYWPRRLWRDDRDHPDAHVEDLIHFFAIDASAFLRGSGKLRGTFQRLVSMTASQFFGSTRGRLSIKPPPVMCARPCSIPARNAWRAAAGNSCAPAGALRLTTCCKPGSFGRRLQPHLLEEYLARERVAVGVQTIRRQAEDDVARS